MYLTPSRHVRPFLRGATLVGAAVSLALASAPRTECPASPEAVHSVPTVSSAVVAVPPEAASRGVIELPSWTARFPSDAELDDDTRDAIAHQARSLAALLPAGSGLRDELFSRLVRLPICGRAHSAAVSGVFAEASPVEIASALAQANTGCDEVLVETAGFAPTVDAGLAARLLVLAEGSPDDAIRRAAWLSYGSLGETAERTGDTALAKEISSRVERELRAAKDARRLVLVKTAGNAACAGCLPEVARDLGSPDVARRTSAVAAYRFVDGRASVAVMCGALAKDAQDAVRDMAAWSLEWRGGAAAERAKCLESSARIDPSRRVRLQAVLALGVLSDGHAESRRALERLAHETDLDMQPFAQRALEVRDATPAPLLAALDD